MSGHPRDFAKLIAVVQQRAELEPDNPEPHYSVAAYYCDEACRNANLSRAQRREHVKSGLAAIDKAIALNPDYLEALVYRGLLLRIEAGMENDADRQKALLDEATAMQQKAIGLKRSG